MVFHSSSRLKWQLRLDLQTLSCVPRLDANTAVKWHLQDCFQVSLWCRCEKFTWTSNIDNFLVFFVISFLCPGPAFLKTFGEKEIKKKIHAPRRRPSNIMQKWLNVNYDKKEGRALAAELLWGCRSSKVARTNCVDKRMLTAERSSSRWKSTCVYIKHFNFFPPVVQFCLWQPLPEVHSQRS